MPEDPPSIYTIMAERVANAILGKINALIGSHNTNEQAHQDIREDIPSASSTTPSADTTTGDVGTGTTWARSNHTHPKSSLYAEATHTHSQYLTSHQDITGKEDKSNKVTSLSSSSTDTEYPSAKIVYDSLQEISKNITFEATFKERTTEQVWMSAYATKLVFTCNTLTDNDLNKNFRVKLNLNSSSIQNINNMVIIVLESTNLSNDFEAQLVNRRLGDEYEMNLLNCDWIITEKTNGNYYIYSYQLNYGLNLLNSNSPYNAIVDNLTTNDATKVLSAKQGKVLNDMIGDAISYINGSGN